MRLRKLELGDAPLMLEWMHDENIVQYLSMGFLKKTLDNCKTFIQESQSLDTDIHMAIVDEKNVYLGTVSLKHIDKEKGTAEFAIAVRNCALGKGISIQAMKTLLNIGTKKLGLKHIFWCVNKQNRRAVRFYEKNLFERVENVPENIKNIYSERLLEQLIWYVYQEV